MINMLTSKLAFPGASEYFLSLSKIVSQGLLSPLFQTGSTMSVLVNSTMPFLSYLSNVPLTTLPPGRPMPKLKIFSYLIAPSQLRNFTKPPHPPPQLIFLLFLIPLPLSPHPNLLLLPKRVASLLKPLPHSVPQFRCAPHKRLSLLPLPLPLPLLPPNPLLCPLLLPLYLPRCLKSPKLHLTHSTMPLLPYLPLLQGICPPLILICLLRPLPCLRPLYRVLIGKRRCVLSYTTLLQFQSNPPHSQCLFHAR